MSNQVLNNFIFYQNNNPKDLLDVLRSQKVPIEFIERNGANWESYLQSHSHLYNDEEFGGMKRYSKDVGFLRLQMFNGKYVKKIMPGDYELILRNLVSSKDYIKNSERYLDAVKLFVGSFKSGDFFLKAEAHLYNEEMVSLVYSHTHRLYDLLVKSKEDVLAKNLLTQLIDYLNLSDVESFKTQRFKLNGEMRDAVVDEILSNRELVSPTQPNISALQLKIHKMIEWGYFNPSKEWSGDELMYSLKVIRENKKENMLIEVLYALSNMTLKTNKQKDLDSEVKEVLSQYVHRVMRGQENQISYIGDEMVKKWGLMPLFQHYEQNYEAINPKGRLVLLYALIKEKKSEESCVAFVKKLINQDVEDEMVKNIFIHNGFAERQILSVIKEKTSQKLFKMQAVKSKLDSAIEAGRAFYINCDDIVALKEKIKSNPEQAYWENGVHNTASAMRVLTAFKEMSQDEFDQLGDNYFFNSLVYETLKSISDNKDTFTSISGKVVNNKNTFKDLIRRSLESQEEAGVRKKNKNQAIYAIREKLPVFRLVMKKSTANTNKQDDDFIVKSEWIVDNYPVKGNPVSQMMPLIQELLEDGKLRLQRGLVLDGAVLNQFVKTYKNKDPKVFVDKLYEFNEVVKRNSLNPLVKNKATDALSEFNLSPFFSISLLSLETKHHKEWRLFLKKNKNKLMDYTRDKYPDFYTMLCLNSNAINKNESVCIHKDTVVKTLERHPTLLLDMQGLLSKENLRSVLTEEEVAQVLFRSIEKTNTFNQSLILSAAAVSDNVSDLFFQVLERELLDFENIALTLLVMDSMPCLDLQTQERLRPMLLESVAVNKGKVVGSQVIKKATLEIADKLDDDKIKSFVVMQVLDGYMDMSVESGAKKAKKPLKKI